MKNICEILRTHEANYSTLGTGRWSRFRRGEVGWRAEGMPALPRCLRLEKSPGPGAATCVPVRGRQAPLWPTGPLGGAGSLAQVASPSAGGGCGAQLCWPGSGVLVTSLKWKVCSWDLVTVTQMVEDLPSVCSVLKHISHFWKHFSNH